MSGPHPLNQAVIAQALHDLRNGQLRRAKSMGFDDKDLDALKHPAMASVLANANVSWCSVVVNRDVLRRLLHQVEDVTEEVVKIDRELLEMVHSIRFSRFFRPKSREDCFHASESTKMSSAPIPRTTYTARTCSVPKWAILRTTR